MSIDEVEKLRKRARNSVLFGVLVSFVGTTFLAIMVGGIFFACYPFIIFIFAKLISYTPKKSFSLAFKKYFLETSLKNMFTDLDYQSEGGIDESIILKSGLLRKWDWYSSTDSFSGKYNGIKFIQAKVYTKREYHDVDMSDTIIFKGIWMIFETNKDFNSNVRVYQKGFREANIYMWSEKNVKMVDEEFNKQFKVYGLNEYYISLILTPSIMEKMKSIASAFKGKIMFGFIGSKLHIAMYSKKDLFKHSVFKKIDENKILDELTNNMKLITSIVDELMINNTNINSTDEFYNQTKTSIIS